MRNFSLFFAAAIASTAFGATRSVPSQFSTIQAAVNAASIGDTISIAAGNYNEQVTIPSGKTGLTLIGAGKTSTRIFVGVAQHALTLNATDTLVKNMTLDIAVGQTDGQQEAVFVTGKQISFNNCLIKGWQDTLQMKTGSQCYFFKCEIWGSVDFIFDGGTAFFDQCTITQIRVANPAGGYNCAPSAPLGTRGIIFSSCYCNHAAGVPNASSVLCRVWKAPGECAHINCSMDHHISPAGYKTWNEDSTSRVAEFNSTWHSDGTKIDLSLRAPWCKRLTSAAGYSKTDILGTWNPRL